MMKTSRLMICAILLIACFRTDASPYQQPAQGRNIRVHIIDGMTGQAIPRVRYMLTGGGLVDGLTGGGDDLGDVELSGIRPGTYRVTLEKAGYFPEPIDLTVTASSPASLPEIVMTTKREVSGAVRWQDGEPAARAQIRVYGVRGGKPVPRTDIPVVQASDRGEFVVGNLRPGRYILLVAPATFTGGIDAAGQFAAGGVPRTGLPVFHPGVNVPDARASIDLRGALAMPNINIILEEKPGVLVEGTVVPSPTAPMGSDVVITLANQTMYSVSTRARAGENFRMGPVPAGVYLLDATTLGPQQGRILVPLTLGGTVFRGIAVSVPPPVILAGRVEIDDPAVRPTANFTVQSEKIAGIIPASASESGEFRIPRTIPGESYGMTVDQRSLPPNAYIAAVTQGSQPLPTSPFQIASGGDAIRVVLKTDGGTVEGRVRESGRAVGQAFVVLAPKDRKIQQNFRTVTADREGVFRIPAVAPGEYDIFAFDRNEDDDYLDELFLQSFADRAQVGKVAARSTSTVELALVRLPRR